MNDYFLPAPYPQPKVIEENPFYACLLMEDYAGLSGELTAINQYIYHSLTLASSYPDFATLTRQIAIVEMHHLDLLGKTIQLLGETPIMCCTYPDSVRFWDAKFIHYGDDFYDKLTSDIRHEAKAIENYRNHQHYIDDPFINEILERIILDEKYHLQLFMKFKDAFDK